MSFLTNLARRVPSGTGMVLTCGRSVRPSLSIRPTSFPRLFKQEGSSIRNFSLNQKPNEGSYMSRISKVLLLLTASATAVGGLYAGSSVSKTSSVQHQDTQSDFTKSIHSQVSAILKGAAEIPGLSKAELELLRNQIGTNWDQLVEQGSLKLVGTDNELRPVAVGIQLGLESVLAKIGNIKELIMFIHTPMPATPLCTKGDISPGLADSKVIAHEASRVTVATRPTTVRQILQRDFCKFHSIYLQDGLKKRTEMQQDIYNQVLREYTHNLFDEPLNCNLLPSNMSGATYLIQDNKGHWHVFAITMTQAANPVEGKGEAKLFFGSMDQPDIQQHLGSVSNYLAESGVESLKEAIAKAQSK